MAKTIHSDDGQAVVDLLKELRNEAGITQIEIAKTLEQSQSLYSKYERGELRLDVLQLRRVVFEFGLTLSEFALMLEKRLKPIKRQQSRRTRSSTRQ
jgi:transcriptional regulator with XRE-family HTH domain